MAEARKFSIRKNRFRKGALTGFVVEGENRLVCKPEEARHVFACVALDGIEPEAKWGRLRFKVKLGAEMVCTAWVLAAEDREHIEPFLVDAGRPVAEKRAFMERNAAIKAVNSADLLLYEQEGRYLYMLFDIIGKGEGELSEICVLTQGDIFMDTFPEIYQEYGSFFHRYMSIFSSLYLDFQEKIDNVAKVLSLENAPVPLLVQFAGWLGVDVSGDFLPEDRLRLLVKEAYGLNKKKGTKEALVRLTEIVLGEKAVILEKNVLRDNTQAVDQKTYEELYGAGTYDVTMLIPTYVPENQRSQLLFLIHQFKPVRSRLLIRFLDERGSLDSHSYLDLNSSISEVEAGWLDDRQPMDGTVLLQE